MVNMINTTEYHNIQLYYYIKKTKIKNINLLKTKHLQLLQYVSAPH